MATEDFTIFSMFDTKRRPWGGKFCKAYENIEKSVLEELVVCDTIPVKHHGGKIRVVSTAELFAIAIRNALENKSINSLFLRSRMANKNS